jgi:uncharacterized protein (TIRG00374 family)
MKTSAKNIITIVFLAIGLGALYYILRQYSLKDIFNVYRNFDSVILLFYIITLAVLMGVLTWRWDVVLKSRNIKIPFRKLYIYRIIGVSINFLTPGPRVGGEPTQASLMTKHNIDFTEGLTTIMIDKIIDVTTSGILFIIGVFLVGMKYSFPRNTEIALGIGGLIFVSLIVTFYYRMLTSRHFFLKLFHFFRLDRIKSQYWIKAEKKVEEVELMMIEFYKHNKKAFIASLAIEYKLATTLLHINVGVPEIFFIVSFVGMAILFPIPMAVGVLEAGQLSAFALIGLNANSAIALAFLVRMKDIVWAIAGVILLATYGFHIGKVVQKKYKNKKLDVQNEMVVLRPKAKNINKRIKRKNG